MMYSSPIEKHKKNMKSNNKQETSSFSCRFEGIRIRSQPGCTGFKRDGADSDVYDSGGGDVVELTFWSLEGMFASCPLWEISTVSYVYTHRAQIEKSWKPS